MTSKSTHPASFDAQLDGRDVCIEFDRVTIFVRDAHYGADADGNRGMCVDMIDDDYAEHVLVLWCRGSSDEMQEFSASLDDLTRAWTGSLIHMDIELKAQVQILLDDWLEKNEPAPPEEPDYPDESDYKEDEP